MAAIVFETFNSKKSPCLQFSNCEQGDFSIQERIWFVPSARPPITPVLLFVPRNFLLFVQYHFERNHAYDVRQKFRVRGKDFHSVAIILTRQLPRRRQAQAQAFLLN